jgi:ketosteroid isomerase-like protein
MCIFATERATMKTLLTFILLILASAGYSQEKFMSVVNAERNFARYAVDYNTRDAFLKFMDTSAVVFNNGEVLKAKQVWEAKKPNKAKLIWEPAFAVVSTGGDIGITTGPWQFKPEGKDSVIATGEFSTVWVKKDTTWKWVVDMGIDHNQKVGKFQNVTGVELNHVERSSYPGLRYMLVAEEAFIGNYGKTGKDAYRDVADNDIYFVTNGHTPVHGVYKIDDGLTNLSGSMKFQMVGSGCSKDGDLGYVYGYVSDKDKKGNYLRVWRRIGRQWMLLLQTLTI